MKIIGIIPARGGSKGIPGKNKKLLAGKPLISYTIENALASRLDKIVISTDDMDIIQLGNDAGIEVIKRPPELSGDLVPTLPVLQHVLANLNEKYDAVMTLQPTSPFRKYYHINEAILLFNEHHTADSLVSVIRVPHNFTSGSLMKQKDKIWLELTEDFGKLILRRQDKPILWARNGAAIYITRIKNIDTFIYGGNILAYQMNKLDSIDIDDMEDWIIADALMEKLNG